jgi:hypothetical protein
MLRRFRATFAGALMCCAALWVTVPASADAAETMIQSRQDHRLCLAARTTLVELQWCDTRNFNQHWRWWQGGWTKAANGFCLTQDRRAVTLRTCSETNPLQMWRHWYGGWWQRVPSQWAREPACLTRTPGLAFSVSLKDCRNPFGIDPPANWYTFPIS